MFFLFCFVFKFVNCSSMINLVLMDLMGLAMSDTVFLSTKPKSSVYDISYFKLLSVASKRNLI